MLRTHALKETFYFPLVFFLYLAFDNAILKAVGDVSVDNEKHVMTLLI